MKTEILNPGYIIKQLQTELAEKDKELADKDKYIKNLEDKVKELEEQNNDEYLARCCIR